MNEILYITTFNKKLFEATGKYMISSFSQCGIEGDLLACFENEIERDIKNISSLILTYNLDGDQFLHNWLKDNADVIPKQYGGKYKKKCKCKDQKKHRDGICPNNGFNKRASCWFRKIASLRYAMTIGYEFVVFVDSDIQFNKKIPAGMIISLLTGNDIFFHYGPYREGCGFESGFIGFNNNGGKTYLDRVIDKYVTKEYRKHKIWADGHIFRDVYKENNTNGYDVVPKNYTFPNHRGVVEYGLFKDYISHPKGSHVKKHGLFK